MSICAGSSSISGMRSTKARAGRHALSLIAGRSRRNNRLPRAHASGQRPHRRADRREEDVAETIEEGLISHRYQLRPQSAVTINLPADLTKTEAERLAAFIQSLPFGS
jgi:hypothetical protein